MTETLRGEPAETRRVVGAQGPDDRRVIGAGSDRYLTFVLRGEVYALPILVITEIMEYRNLTVVPMMPSFIRGVINLRGRVVPVVDLAARFDSGTTTVARRTSIVIVEVDSPAGGRGEAPDPTARSGPGEETRRTAGMGIMVDAVNKVMHLSADDIEPPPAFGAGISTDFISGMAKYNGEFIIVLNVARVLSVDQVAQVVEAVRAPVAQVEPQEAVQG